MHMFILAIFLCFTSLCDSTGPLCLPEFLHSALEGYDAQRANIFVSPDPGSRKRIFAPCISSRYYSTPDLPNREFACDASVTFKNLASIDEYSREQSSDISFTSEEDSTRKPEVKVEDAIRQHFLNGGKVFAFRAFCYTHSFRMDPLLELENDFLEALHELDIHSLNPDSKEARRSVKQFVRHYGTHYRENSLFGSSITIEVRIRSPPSREPDLMLLTQSVNNFLSVHNFSAEAFQNMYISHYFHDNEPEIKVNIATKGKFGVTSLKSWHEKAIENPTVLKSEIRKLTDLITLINNPENSNPYDIHYRIFHNGTQHIADLLERHNWMEVTGSSHYREALGELYKIDLNLFLLLS